MRSMKIQQDQSEEERQDRNLEQAVDQTVEDRYHKGALAYLKTLIGD